MLCIFGKSSATFSDHILFYHPVYENHDVGLVLYEAGEHVRVDLLDLAAQGQRAPVGQPLQHVELALQIALVRDEVPISNEVIEENVTFLIFL